MKKPPEGGFFIQRADNALIRLSTAQLGRDFSDAFTVGFGGVQIALRNFFSRSGWTNLGHQARVGADAVDGAVVHGWLTDPDHALLHRQGDEVLDG